MQILIEIELEPDKVLRTAMSRAKTVTRANLETAVKEVMRDTIVLAVKERYAALGANIYEVAEVARGKSHSARFQSQHIRAIITRISRNIAKAQQAGNRGEVAELQQRLRGYLREFITGAVSHTASEFKQAKNRKLREALDAAIQLKREKFAQLMSRLTSETLLKGNLQQLEVGIGLRAEFDRYTTPSATEILSKRPSTSLYRILWLQMEYGAGLYAKTRPEWDGSPAALHMSRFKTAVGSWWYGGKAGQGVHFAGQRPANIFRDATGLPYQKDMLAFNRIFGQKMVQLLLG